MGSRSLTAAVVERIRPPKAGQVDYFDKGFPGLALRVSYGSAKAWVYFYRLHGKLRRLTLGRWPSMDLASARNAWRDARRLVDMGENPARARPVAADSFGAVAAEWLKRDQAQNRSVNLVRGIVERYPLPAWGDRPAASITRRDVIELIDLVADRGHLTMAHRLHAHLHRLFRWSVGRGILEMNPMADLPRQGEVVKRDRVLSDAELALVWKAAADTEWPFGPLFRLLILTGARREEIGALRWQEIQGDRIELQGSRTKNSEAHTIPLSRQAAALIERLPRVADCEFVFSTTGKTPVSGWSRAKRLLDQTASNLNRKRTLPDWRLHDLRRTIATGLQRLGVNLQVIEAVLGHIAGSRAGIVGVYQRHAFGAEKRAALDAWARHVEGIVSGKKANVTQIRRAAS